MKHAQHPQGGRGVRAPTAQSGSGRDALQEPKARRERTADQFLNRAVRAQHQVVFEATLEGGHGFRALGQQQVVEGQRLKPGGQVVMPVRAPAGDPQRHIHLGVRGKRESAQRSISTAEVAWASASSR